MFENLLKRTCYKCKDKKLLKEFNASKKDKIAGKRYSCRACDAVEAKQYRLSEIGIATKKKFNAIYCPPPVVRTQEQKEAIKIKRKNKEYPFQSKIIPKEEKENILKEARIKYYIPSNESELSRSDKNKKKREDLTDSYVKKVIRIELGKTAGRDFIITQELIELKRIIIKTNRLCQQLASSQRN